MVQLTTYRKGESRTGRYQAMRLSAAIQRVAAQGLVRTLVRSDDIEADPCVAIIQDWHDDGREMAVFVRAYGKYRGNSLGSADAGAKLQ
jgi:hypothetical protein